MTAPGRKRTAARVSDNDVTTVKEAIAGIRQTLSFLVSLPSTEISHTFKLGDQRWPFTQIALQAAQDNPGIVPPAFDLAGFAALVALFDELGELQTVVDQLSSDLKDTRISVGGQALQAALAVKKLVDANLSSTPGLKTVADKLAAAFVHVTVPTPPPAAKG